VIFFAHLRKLVLDGPKYLRDWNTRVVLKKAGLENRSLILIKRAVKTPSLRACETNIEECLKGGDFCRRGEAKWTDFPDLDFLFLETRVQEFSSSSHFQNSFLQLGPPSFHRWKYTWKCSVVILFRAEIKNPTSLDATEKWKWHGLMYPIWKPPENHP
jgi:hypothetical protein